MHTQKLVGVAVDTACPVSQERWLGLASSLDDGVPLGDHKLRVLSSSETWWHPETPPAVCIDASTGRGEGRPVPHEHFVFCFLIQVPFLFHRFLFLDFFVFL